MKRIDVAVRQGNLDDVRDRLNNIGVEGLTITEVIGVGRQKGHSEFYRGCEYKVDFHPKLLLTIVAREDQVDEILEAIVGGARTGLPTARTGRAGVGASSYLGNAGQGVTGLFYGDSRQFLCQLMGATLCAASAFGSTYGVFAAVNKIKSMRLAPEVELQGRDIREFGLKGYPEDNTVTMEA